MIVSYWVALQIACYPIICISYHNIIIKKIYRVNTQIFFCLIHYVGRLAPLPLIDCSLDAMLNRNSVLEIEV